jgi:hypothetical protein
MITMALPLSASAKSNTLFDDQNVLCERSGDGSSLYLESILTSSQANGI